MCMFQFLVEENEKIQKEKLLEEYNDAYPWTDIVFILLWYYHIPFHSIFPFFFVIGCWYSFHVK